MCVMNGQMKEVAAGLEGNGVCDPHGLCMLKSVISKEKWQAQKKARQDDPSILWFNSFCAPRIGNRPLRIPSGSQSLCC